MKQKALLAFSGGLDTSYCVLYLKNTLNLEVYTATVQTGGFSVEELQDIERRAISLGSNKHYTIDATSDFYNECLKYLIFGNVLKNNTYPLSVSAERVFQAKTIAKLAKELGAKFLVHGSTGAGNDQVRFDAIFQVYAPDIEILTPIRDNKLSREAEIKFLKENGVDIEFHKAQYSINKGLWGTTIGGKETLSSRYSIPEEAYPIQVTKTDSEEISISFSNGEVTAVNGVPYSNSVEAIIKIAELTEPFGIGRDIHVGDTIIGIKGRVAFQASAPVVIIKAHHLLEKHTLTKFQLNTKEVLAAWYGQSLHEGQFLEPGMRHIEEFLKCTQQTVSGTVYIKLSPYRFELIGIESENDLMSAKFGSYGEMNNAWTGEDVKGFTTIQSQQARIFGLINPKLVK